MQLYKCDRCGTIMNKEVRFSGRVRGYIVDLCENCHKEFTKDLKATKNLYEKNLEAIEVKYGMRTISSLLKGDE